MTRLSRRQFLAAAAAGAASCLLGPSPARAAAPAGKKPNFVLIFIDDMGYGDIEPFGQDVIKTPNLNRMAAEGMKLTDFYSANPVCSPSRAALMTGCYPTRVTVPRVLFHDDKWGLSDKEITIAKLLKAEGYATQCVGKWHLGHRPDFLPTRRGFDHYLGIPYSNDMAVDPQAPLADDVKLGEGLTPETFRKITPQGHSVPLYRDEKVIEYPVDQTQLVKRYTEESVRFIETNKDKPFFLYLPHTMVHVPLFASEAFNGKSPRGIYGDCVQEVDWSVGQILDCLSKNGLAENTLVMFTSDNGPWLIKKEHGGTAGPLREGKGTTYEGGMREPTLAWWPGTIKPGSVCKEVAGTIDVLPTFAALAGAPAPADRVIDGHDITPLLKGEPGAKSKKDETGYYYYSNINLQAVRCGKWKLRKAGANPIELYNLEEDIGEKNNLAEREPEVVARLKKMMEDFDASLWANQRPADVEGGGQTKAGIPRPGAARDGQKKNAPKGQKKAKAKK